MRKLLIVIALLFGAYSCFASDALPADQMEAMIVGTWSEEYELDGVRASAVSKYTSGHSVEQLGTFTAENLRVDYRLRARWSIQGDTLVTEVLESSHPELVAVGHVERDTILSMTTDQWVYRDADGVEFTAKRVLGESP